MADEKPKDVVTKVSKLRMLQMRLPAVEPVLFAAFLALITMKITDGTIIFKLTCYHNFAKDDPSIDCWYLSNKTIETKIHRRAANWSTLQTLAVLSASFFSNLLLGAWGDRVGRKMNMLFGFTGVMMMGLGLIVANSLLLPVWTIVVVGFFVGLTGFIGIIPTSCFAFLSDRIVDRQYLSIRMMTLSTASATAAILSSAIVGLVADRFGLSWVLVISECAIVCGFTWALFFVPQIPPKLHKELMIIAEKIGETEITPEVINEYKKGKVQPLAGEKGEKKTKQSLMTTIIELFKETYTTFAKKREGNRRLYLMLCIPSFVLHISAELATHGVIALYVFHSPFHWRPSMLGYFGLSNGFANLFGVIFSIAVFQKMFKFRNSTLCLISLVSNFARMLVIGIARNGWLLFVANVLGLFSHLMMPAIKGLSTGFVEPDEVGKAFTGFSLSIDVAIVIGSLVYNQVYNATLEFYTGTVFLVTCGAIAAAFLIMLWIHIDYGKEQSRVRATEQKEEVTRL